MGFTEFQQVLIATSCVSKSWFIWIDESSRLFICSWQLQMLNSNSPWQGNKQGHLAEQHRRDRSKTFKTQKLEASWAPPWDGNHVVFPMPKQKLWHISEAPLPFWSIVALPSLPRKKQDNVDEKGIETRGTPATKSRVLSRQMVFLW